MLAASSRVVLFDPVKGNVLNLSNDEFMSVFRATQHDQWPTLLFNATSWAALPGLRVLSGGGPGATFGCLPPLSTYTTVSDSETGAKRSFYIVELHQRAVRRLGFVCNPGGRRGVPYYSTVTDAGGDVLPLPNRELLINTINPNFLIRLDRSFRAKSTMGGRIVLLDADPVNKTLLERATDGDIGIPLRVQVFENAVAQLHAH